MEYVCTRCDSKESAATRSPVCGCGGLWKLDFQPPRFQRDKIRTDMWGIFRYQAFLPVEETHCQAVSMGEGMTPVIPFAEDLWLKMDYCMPTLSFKDRGAAVMMAHCRALGTDHVVQDSSGNAGNSVAAYSARAGIQCDIYVPENTSESKKRMIQSHGARLQVITGNRDRCADACRERVDREGIYYASHVYNPFFYEGTKTYLYEVYEQMGRIPQTLIIPLGNGTLFLGVMKALEEFLASGIIDKIPRILAVQSERCDPIARAMMAGDSSPHAVIPRPTMAEGIAIGKPQRGAEILSVIRRFGVEVVTAPENRIMEARSLMASKGVYIEHTTAATVAAYLVCRKQWGRLPDCLIPMCGAGIKSDK